MNNNEKSVKTIISTEATKQIYKAVSELWQCDISSEPNKEVLENNEYQNGPSE